MKQDPEWGPNFLNKLHVAALLILKFAWKEAVTRLSS